jgi:hypothetical protein
MNKQVEQLTELRTIIAKQQKLLRIALYLMSEGLIKYADTELKCELAEDQVRATTAVAMGAGHALRTERGLSCTCHVMPGAEFSLGPLHFRIRTVGVAKGARLSH